MDTLIKTSNSRISFPGLSSRAFEHPADRAALGTMRKIPGFDTLMRKWIAVMGERSLRTMYLASAVKVNERQFPKLYATYKECLEILDFESEPELFVTQTPLINAGAVGTESPFIVLNSGALDLFGEDELRFLLGHELGHIMADHVLYKTMLRLLIRASVLRFGIPWGYVVLYGIIAGLSEWDRKSELSADRAGYLCVQDREKASRVFMKLAGGSKSSDLDLDAFIAQSEEYKSGGNKLDSIYKLLNLLGQTHPFPVLRLAELRDWLDSASWQAMQAGDYARRDARDKTSVYEDFKASAESYRQSYAQSGDPLFQFFKDIKRDAGDKGSAVFQKIRDTFGTKPD